MVISSLSKVAVHKPVLLSLFYIITLIFQYIQVNSDKKIFFFRDTSIFYYIIYYITNQGMREMKPKDEVTRSLLIDRKTWDDAMMYARARYKMSLSKVIERLLQEWLAKERRKPLDNEKQGKFF